MNSLSVSSSFAFKVSFEGGPELDLGGPELDLVRIISHFVTEPLTMLVLVLFQHPFFLLSLGLIRIVLFCFYPSQQV